MLKKEMQNYILALQGEIGILEQNNTNLKDEISRQKKTIAEYRKLQNNCDAALEAILAIQATSCQESYNLPPADVIYHMRENGEELPPRPIDPLFDALQHIERILHRPVKEESNSLNSRYSL